MEQLLGSLASLFGAIIVAVVATYIVRAFDGVPDLILRNRRQKLQRRAERLDFAKRQHRSVESFVLTATLRLVAFSMTALFGLAMLALCVALAPSPMRELLGVALVLLLGFSMYLASLLADTALLTAGDYRDPAELDAALASAGQGGDKPGP